MRITIIGALLFGAIACSSPKNEEHAQPVDGVSEPQQSGTTPCDMGVPPGWKAVPLSSEAAALSAGRRLADFDRDTIEFEWEAHAPYTVQSDEKYWHIRGKPTDYGVLQIVLCKENSGILRFGFLFAEAPSPVGELFEKEETARALAKVVMSSAYKRPVVLLGGTRQDERWTYEVVTEKGETLLVSVRSRDGAVSGEAAPKVAIPDRETAVAAAEIALGATSIGEGLLRQRPFEVALRGDVWYVDTTRPLPEPSSGTAQVRIRQSDAAIIGLGLLR